MEEYFNRKDSVWIEMSSHASAAAVVAHASFKILKNIKAISD